MLTLHRITAGALLLAAAMGCAGDPETAGPAPEPWREPMQAAEQAFREQKLPQAETAFREMLRVAEASTSVQGRVMALEGLATVRALQGDMAAADSLYRQVLDVQSQRFAADSLGADAFVRILGTLGEINLRLGATGEAEGFFGRILEMAATGAVDLPAEEPILAYAIRGLGVARAARGDASADSLERRAQGLQLYAQGFAALVGEDLDAAEKAYREALQAQTAGAGATGADIGRTAAALARLLELRGRAAEALSLFEQAAAAYADDGGAPADHAAALSDWAAALPPSASARADSLRQRAAELLRGR